MSNADFEDGEKASTEIQMLILKMMNDGIDPKSIALVCSGIGSMMLIKHYGTEAGIQLAQGMIDTAAEGKFELYPGLQVANQNAEDE